MFFNFYFILFFTDTYRLNINELYLETHVRGQPMPTIEWVKDGVTLSRDDSKYHIIDHPDGLCELTVNNPNHGDSGKYVCKAFNRCGTTEIPHFVLYEGKAAHIAENIHGVYHADHSRLDRAKSEIRERTGITNGASTENGVADEKEDKKGGKGGKRGGRTEPAAPAATTTTSSAPAKKESREARVSLHFPTKLSNRVVAEGSKVKLTCYLEAADPMIKWFKDDQPVVFSPKCRQNNNNGLCILEITNASVADTGVYKCLARNTSGECSTSAKLEVYSSAETADLAPTFTRSLKEIYHSNINEINITCHVRGMPTPIITWVKDGVTIEPNEKYQQIENDDGLCELNISDATKQDNGKYVCQAENRAGNTEITHIVQIDIRPQRSSLASLKDLPATPDNEEVKENGSAEEKPSAGGAAKGKGQRKKGSVSSSSGGGGGGRRQPAPPPDPKQQLYFLAFLTDRTEPENGKTKLSCYVQGPDPQVRWFKDEKQIQYSARCRCDLKDGLITLNILNLTQEDTGEYRVLVRNQASEISSSCQLNVYETIKSDATPVVFTNSIKGKLFWSVFVNIGFITFRYQFNTYSDIVISYSFTFKATWVCVIHYCFFF